MSAVSTLTSSEKIVARDRASTLHPFVNLHAYAHGQAEATVVDGAKGSRIRDVNGREYLDGFAGLYCMNIGYGRSEVAEAISKQAHQLAFAHSYAGQTTEQLARLSHRLVSMSPGQASKVFYGMSGSDANETNVKIVWYYNNLRGKPEKKKIIARDRGYHGCSIVSGSLTGMSFYHAFMDLPRPSILHTGVAHHYWGAEPGETEEQFSLRRARELDELIQREGPDTVGGFIAEPVMGTGGITPPPKGYWDAIQKVLRKHDILLIADEVITGFGRTGEMFGCDAYGIEPDLITLAKGLTSAYVPLSASVVAQRVYEVMERGAETVGSFSHGYTYSGHTLGVAAANAVLDIVEREDIPGQAKRTGAHLQAALRQAFAGMPIVGEVRGVGMMAAVEFVADPKTRQRFDPAVKVGARVSQACRDRGLIARAMPMSETLGFSPPLTMTLAEVDEMIGIAADATRAVMNQL